MRNSFFFLFFSLSLFSFGQSDYTQHPGFLSRLYDDDFRDSSNPYSKRPWYENIRINGYMQFRGNAKSNPDMYCEQCDATYGGNKGFIIRRMRLKVTGWVHPRVYFYFQGDFASDGNNLGQLRDAYFDTYLDKKNTTWFRFGQSKVMYGFDNMQSSQNRIPLDRSDPINSAIKNERDMMISFYHTPEKRKKYFKELVLKGLKGSGNYGAFAFGIYNGQTANAFVPEDNDGFHVVGHLTWPMKTKKGQYIETSLNAYYGQYQTTNVSDGVLAKDQFGNDGNWISADGAFFDDGRIGCSFMYYPQPIGFQMEYNVGTGPQYNAALNAIENEFLHGGYVTLIGNIMVGKSKMYPFIRMQYYQGGKKFELDARKIDMAELEIGTEWSPYFPFEIQLTYAYARRDYSDAAMPMNNQTGHLIRVQFQVNY